MKKLALILLVCVVSTMASAALYCHDGTDFYLYTTAYPTDTNQNCLTQGNHYTGDTTVTITTDTRDGIYSQGSEYLWSYQVGRNSWDGSATDTDTLNVNAGGYLACEGTTGQLLVGKSGIVNINAGGTILTSEMMIGGASGSDTDATVNVSGDLLVTTAHWCISLDSVVTISAGGLMEMQHLSDKYESGGVSIDPYGGNVNIYQGGMFRIYVDDASSDDRYTILSLVDSFITAADDSDLVVTYNDSLGDYGAYEITAVPEPATLVLLGLGGMLSLRRRR